MPEQDEKTIVVPVLEEEVTVGKQRVETGRVRISIVVDSRQEWVEQTIEREQVSVERVPIDRVLDSTEPLPPVREEGDILIIPVLEERVVVQKLLVLKEEVHVRRQRTVEHVQQPVTLRTERAIVEHEDIPSDISIPPCPQKEGNL